MSYVDQDNRREKSLSGAASVVLVAGIGYALVTGLAVNIIHIEPPTPIIHNYPPDASPPPEHIKPLPRTPMAPATTTTPPPPLAPIVLPPIDRGTIIALPPFPPFLPPSGGGVSASPGDDGASLTGQAVAAMPRGAPGDWVTTDDYPQAALRAGAEGRTRFRLDIGINGRVTDCTITQSSGSTDLDAAACRVLRQTARFTPARDAAGNAVPSSYANNVVWKLPGE